MAERDDAAHSLGRLLAVEEIDTDLYRGRAAADAPGHLFGGQVIAQGLASASASVGAERTAHSLHAYFLRAGDAGRPIVYRVIRDFDGGSFANRRVVALQGGRPILNLAASFQKREEGLAHAAAMPEVPGPEDSTPFVEVLRARGAAMPPSIADRIAAFDIRAACVDARGGTRGLPTQASWFRLHETLDPALARVALAYASDFGLVSTAILPHGVAWFDTRVRGASLDHAMWFHADPPLGQWLLYAMDSPWAGKGRGFARGSVYDRQGHLIASMAQEGLMRVREETPSP